MRRIVILLTLVVCGLLFSGQSVSALGLKIVPLEYKSALKKEERKKGFVDISNPTMEAVDVSVSVQAFKQINDDGGLQFYDDKQLSLGIKPELSSLELGPREAIRLFFTIDSTQLPEGNVFAAIFFTTEPKQPRSGVGQLVRVGTLLSLVNQNPGERSAEVTGLSLPLIQFSDTISGSYSIKNVGEKSSGFYPMVAVSSRLGGKRQQVESSLVFGGRERSNDFTYRTGFGIHLIEASYGTSKMSRWVITVAPWMVVVSLLIATLVAIELLVRRKRRKFIKSQRAE